MLAEMTTSYYILPLLPPLLLLLHLAALLPLLQHGAVVTEGTADITTVHNRPAKQRGWLAWLSRERRRLTSGFNSARRQDRLAPA